MAEAGSVGGDCQGADLGRNGQVLGDHHRVHGLARYTTDSLKSLIKRQGYHGPRIQHKLGCTRNTLGYYLRRAGLSLRPKLRYTTNAELERGLARSPTWVAATKRFKVSKYTLRRVCEERGVPHYHSHISQRAKLVGVSPEVVAKLYINVGYNWNRVAERLGVHVRTMHRYVTYHNLESARGHSRYSFTRELLVDMYVERKLSMHAIAKAMRERHGGSCSGTTVRQALDRFGIPRRGGVFGPAASVEARARGLKRKDGRWVAEPVPKLPRVELSDDAWEAEPDAS